MTSSAGSREGQDNVAATSDAVPEDEQQLKQEIEQTREELGHTVAALAAKADVKARARAKAAALAARVKGSGLSDAGQAARQRMVPLAGAGVALIVGLIAVRRWRKR